MQTLPQRRTSELRKGRVSWAGARYFITCCAVRPETRLVRREVGNAILNTIARIEETGDMYCLCATVMPDHVHIVCQLGDRLSLSRIVGKFKSLVLRDLRSHGIQWQENFFEHRLRPEEDTNAYARYVFMNPYRAQLVRRTEVWKYWVSGCRFAFQTMLDEWAYPPEEWIREDVTAFGLAAQCVGE